MSTIQEHEQQALDAFQANVAGLAQVELDRLEAERVQLEESLKIVRNALRAVKATLAATRGPVSKNGSKPKVEKQGKVFSPSPAAADAFRVWLDKQPEDRDLTTKALFEDPSTEWSVSYCGMLMNWGREQGLIRQSGAAGPTRIYRRLG